MCRASATTARCASAIGDYLAEVYQGHVSAFYPFFPEGPLTRVHFIIGRDVGDDARSRPRRRSRQAVAAIVRTWSDALGEALLATRATRSARRRCSRATATAFSDGYREAYSPQDAVADIRVIEALSPDRPLGVDFYRAQPATSTAVRRPEGLEPPPADPAVRARAGAGEHGLQGGRRADLSRSRLAADGEPGVWLHDMMLERADGGAVDLDAMRAGSRPRSSW